MSKGFKVLLAILLPVILAGGGAYYWFVIKPGGDVDPQVAGAANEAAGLVAGGGQTGGMGDRLKCPDGYRAQAGTGVKKSAAATTAGTSSATSSSTPATGGTSPANSGTAGSSGAAPAGIIATGSGSGGTRVVADGEAGSAGLDGEMSIAAADAPPTAAAPASSTPPSSAAPPTEPAPAASAGATTTTTSTAAAGASSSAAVPAGAKKQADGSLVLNDGTVCLPNNGAATTPGTSSSGAATTSTPTKATTATPSTGTAGSAASAGTAAAGSAAAAGTTGGAAAGATAAGAVTSTMVVDGSNTSNTSEGLAAAKQVAALGSKFQLTFNVNVQLVPTAGSLAKKPAALRAYRKRVVAATLRIELADDVSLQQWKATGAANRKAVVRNFLGVLRRRYPNAARSVTMISSAGTILATGDAVSGSTNVVLVG